MCKIDQRKGKKKMKYFYIKFVDLQISINFGKEKMITRSMTNKRKHEIREKCEKCEKNKKRCKKGKAESLEKIKGLYLKKQNLRRMFSKLQESSYNIFAGQQICAMRSIDMERYIDEFPKESQREACQCVYDAGIVLLDFGIIKRDKNGNYSLNEKFGDYEDWKPYEEMVIKNCNFLRYVKHPSYI